MSVPGEGKNDMNKRKIGSAWEEAAVCYLQRAGVCILARNFKCSQGEIDIIGYHHDCLVFFEVKYRKDDQFGKPEEAVGIAKQEKISRCALFYLQYHGGLNQAIRFDVLAICGEKISWYQNAFPYRKYRRRREGLGTWN